jgi:hydroxyacylglutathione hydrolase
MIQVNPLSQARADAPQIVPVKAFTDNYIWLVSNGEQALVVDPGEASPVFKVLAQHGLELTTILLTHHHQDHVGGVTELTQATGAKVWGPALEVLPQCDYPLSEGDSVDLPVFGLSLSVLDIPGHTAGHIAYFGTFGTSPLVFCGDTLFAGGCGRIFEGSPEQMHQSLGKLAALAPQTLVYCTHEYTASNLRFAVVAEPDNTLLKNWQQQVLMQRANDQTTLPSTIAQELAANPFLRTQQATVIRTASEWAQRPLFSALEVFSALREWKNGFR